MRDFQQYVVFYRKFGSSNIRRVWLDTAYCWKNGGKIDFVIFEEGKKKASIELIYQAKVSLHNSKVLKNWVVEYRNLNI